MELRHILKKHRIMFYWRLSLRITFCRILYPVSLGLLWGAFSRDHGNDSYWLFRFGVCSYSALAITNCGSRIYQRLWLLSQAYAQHDAGEEIECNQHRLPTLLQLAAHPCKVMS